MWEQKRGCELTLDSLMLLMKGDIVLNPTVQLLESSYVCTENSLKRYRLHLSDGNYSHTFAVTSIPALSEPPENFSIIILKKYSLSDWQEHPDGAARILIILDFNVLKRGSTLGCKLGNPVLLTIKELQTNVKLKFRLRRTLASTKASTSSNQPINENSSNTLIQSVDNGLSAGALESIMRGDVIENPIVQILETKSVSYNTAGDKKRYRAVISDSKHFYTSAFISIPSQLEPPEDFSIVKLTKYLIDVQRGRKLLLILTMDLVTKGSIVGHELGNSIMLNIEIPQSTESLQEDLQNTLDMVQTSSILLNWSTNDQNRVITAISALTPDMSSTWTIKARVTAKSDLRTWCNSKGEGKFFTFDLLDQSGEIRCIVFKELADVFFSYMQIGSSYFISNCQMEAAKKQLFSPKHDYQMIVTNETFIEESMDDNIQTIPQIEYNFKPIKEIKDLEVGIMVDLIGVCIDVSDVKVLKSKFNNFGLRYREIFLIDQAETEIILLLWGADADIFDPTDYPVVAVNEVKVAEYRGTQVVVPSARSQIKMNPNIFQRHKLKSWFEKDGKHLQSLNICTKVKMGYFQTPWMSFNDVQEGRLAMTTKGAYFLVLGTIIDICDENAVYKACPIPDCNESVIDFENDTYRCEKCGKNFPNFKYMLLMSMNVADWSGSQTVSVFGAEAETILEMSAQEIGAFWQIEAEAFFEAFERAKFKEFIFKCRAQMENYNGEKRLQVVAIRVHAVNYEECNNALLGNLEVSLKNESEITLG